MIVLFTSLLKLGITFPFLIGKVLTEVHTVNARRRFKFPFLIGKVLTTLGTKKLIPFRRVRDNPAKRRFPFLIGKVLTDTDVSVEHLNQDYYVSIPYR